MSRRMREPTGQVTGSVSHTPPHGLLLGVLPDAAVRPLVTDLVTLGRQVPGVNGVATAAAHFAAIWVGRTGQRAVLRDAERLYPLLDLVPPDPSPPGRTRAATMADIELLRCWFEGFGKDAGLEVFRLPHLGLRIEDLLSYGGLTVWEDDGGRPVSMAGRSRPAAGVVRIGPVYTPPEHRRQGRGSAVTAAVSQAAQNEGAREVVLFTDLANPTSNSIYRRLGYHPLGDRLVLRFEPMGR